MYIYVRIIPLWISCVYHAFMNFVDICIYVYIHIYVYIRRYMYICIYICVYHTFMNFVKQFPSSNHLKKAGKVYAYITCVHARCVLKYVNIYIRFIEHFRTYQQILDKKTQKCVRHTSVHFLCEFHICVEREYISDYWKPFLHLQASF